MKDRHKRLLIDFLPPLIALAAVTILIRSQGLDLAVSRTFFDPDLPQGFDKRVQPWYFIAKYGEYAAHVVAGIAGVIWVASFFREKLKPHRRRAMFVWLLIVIGPVLTVNIALKSMFQRPRPNQIHEFRPTSGKQFVDLLEIGESGRRSAFPSGHAAGAFCMTFPFFLLRGRRRLLSYVFLAIGLSWGTLMGFCRIIQGRHFIGDVIWSAAIVWLLSLALYYLLLANEN
jgi:membrane-associated PAP2 superfamily phosphatase